MRVLVTGGSGYIGAHLIRRFTDVHAVSRRPRESVHGERWHVADLADADQVTKLIDEIGPDAVVHLASEVTGKREVGQVGPTLRGNLLSAVNLLTACAGRDIRLVLAGSVEEPRPGATPSSPYAVAKGAATGYARMFHELWQVPVTVLRVAMVYGPGDPNHARLLPYVSLSLLREEEPELTNGTRLIDWVYVDDVVDAFVRAVECDTAGHVLDVGSGTQTSIRDTVELLVKVAGSDIRPRYGAVASRPLDTAQLTDIVPTARKIGWRPKTGLEEGLRRTYEYYNSL